MSSWPSIPRRLLLAVPAGCRGEPRRRAARGRAAAAEGGTPDACSRASISHMDGILQESQRTWAYADRQSLKPGEPLNIRAAGGPRASPCGARGWRCSGSPPASPRRCGPAISCRSAIAAPPGPAPPSAPAGRRPFPGSTPAAGRPAATTPTSSSRRPRRGTSRPPSGSSPIPGGRARCWRAWGPTPTRPTTPGAATASIPNDDDENRGLVVSFGRPTETELLRMRASSWSAGWRASAASLGGVDYASNFDVRARRDPHRALPPGADQRPMTSTGAARSSTPSFHRRIFHAGRNTAFLGAGRRLLPGPLYGDLNRGPGASELGLTSWSATRPRPTLSPCAPGKADPRRLTTNNFRTDARRPETMLMGGAYLELVPAGRPAAAPPYLVARTDMPFFEGTGWKTGDVAADVVGYEWDNRDPDGDGKRLWDAARLLDLARSIPPPSACSSSGEAIADDGSHGVAEGDLLPIPARGRAGVQRRRGALARVGAGQGGALRQPGLPAVQREPAPRPEPPDLTRPEREPQA